MKTAGEKSNHSTAVQQKAAPTSFFRKAGEESFFGTKEQSSFFSAPVQAKLSVSTPDDPQEKEADAMAEHVMRMPEPVTVNAAAEDDKKIDKKEEEKLERKADSNIRVQRSFQTGKLAAKPYTVLHRFTTDSSFSDREAESGDETINRKHISLYPSDVVQRSGRGPPVSSPRFESSLASSKGGGSALPEPTRDNMGSRFGADFSNVRIHTGHEAENMSSTIHAQAFTHGNDIYFNSVKYAPETTEGGLLLAHELTHTIQQGASPAIAPSVQRKCSECESSQEHERGPPVSVDRKEMIQRSVVDDALSFAGSVTDCISLSLDTAIACAKDKAQQVALHIPGYRALRVVLGQDPITGQRIERNGHNFIEAAFDIMPGGLLIHRKLNELHQLDAAAAFIDRQIGAVTAMVNGLFTSIRNFWNSLGVSDLSSPLDVLRRGVNIVLGFINDVIDFAVNAATELITMIKDWLLNQIVEFIRTRTPVYPLLTVILGHDPVTGREVAANGTNILNALLELGGEEGRQQRAKMQETGSWDRVVGFIDEGIAVFGGAYEQIVQGFRNIWSRVSIESLMDPVGTFQMIYNEFAEPVSRVWNFVRRVGAAILQFVKEVFLRRLAAWARTVRGYHLLTVILNRDPFTGENVPRTMTNVIRGFMSLMEGGEEQFQQLQQSGAIERTTARINAAIARLNMTPSVIIQLFIDLWTSFTIHDFLDPIAAFRRIIDRFGEPIGRLIAFVVEIVKIVIEVILAVMNFPSDLIRNIITKAMQAFDLIKRDPVGFLKNLLRALKQGFIQFFNNIGTHLINGLTGWLMAEMRDANVRPPTDFSLRGIIGWTLELLGISMESIWQKLAAHPRIGPQRVARIRSMINTLEGIWTFIKDVQERGIAAIWERIQAQLSRLWDTILDAVKNWVMERIVTTMTTRLLSMLDPTGIMAVINSAIAIYRAIQSFIRYLRQMLEVVNSFVEGTLAIAQGNIAPAANHLERTLDRAMPIVIGFLANQVGLSGLGARIGEMIGRARVMVDQALTWLVNRAVDTAMGLLDRLMAMGRNALRSLMNWARFDNPFRTKDNQNHTIKIEEENGRRVVNVYSFKERLDDFFIRKASEIQRMTPGQPKTDKEQHLTSAQTQYGLITDLIADLYRLEQLPVTPDITIEKNQKEPILRRCLGIIKNDLKELGLTPGGGAISTLISFEGQRGSQLRAIAFPLTILPGSQQGSPPRRDASFPPGWDHISLLPSTILDIHSWNRMHLIPQRLHGSGSEENNIIPAHNDVNNPAGRIEQNAINALRNPLNAEKVLKYQVTVDFNHANYPNFPSRVRVDWVKCVANAAGTSFTEEGDHDNWDSQRINEPPSGIPTHIEVKDLSEKRLESIFGPTAGRRIKAAHGRDFLSRVKPYSLVGLQEVYTILASHGGNERGFSNATAARDWGSYNSKLNTLITLVTPATSPGGAPTTITFTLIP